MAVTSIDQMKKSSAAREIQIPGWGAELITVEVRRPSLLNMASRGDIPNGLLSVAQKLFTGGLNDVSKADFKDISNIMKKIAVSTLVKPSYKEMKDNGIELTDQQITLLYNYAQEGVRSLERFRIQQGDIEGDKTGEVPQKDAK